MEYAYSYDLKHILTILCWFVSLKLTFMAGGRHSLLWPVTTTFERLQGAYFRPETVTVCFD